MLIKDQKNIKRVTYMFLSLASLMLSSEIQAMEDRDENTPPQNISLKDAKKAILKASKAEAKKAVHSYVGDDKDEKYIEKCISPIFSHKKEKIKMIFKNSEEERDYKLLHYARAFALSTAEKEAEKVAYQLIGDKETAQKILKDFKFLGMQLTGIGTKYRFR